MTVRNDEPLQTEPAADADLILRTRSGDGTAFGELWRRHYPSGIAVARSITSSIDPDDLVQESYTRIFQAILKGGGPNGSFRAYLFTSIRNTAAAWGRARRETAMDELETVPDPDSTEQAASEALDRGLTAQAFRSLPTRWQEVLWYTEIEQMKPAEVAPLLGMKSGAVSQLAFRAREGLREAWVQAHLRSTASDSECHWTIDHLGAYSRGNLSTRDRKRADAHLKDCARCVIVAGEAKDVSSRLALVLLPLVLGAAGAAGYSAVLQSGAPVVAVAAMPSSVVAGGVVVSGAGLPVGLDGAATGAGGTGGASGGAITGIGALVGAGSAALVVAGVVAAATVVPGLLDASPVTSLPSAGDADSSAISSEVAPDGSIESDEKLQLEVSDDAPKKKEDADRAPKTAPPAPPVSDDVPAPPPASAEEPGDGEGGDRTEPTQPPADPTNPDPGDGEIGDPDPGDGTDPTDPGDGEGGDPDDSEGTDPGQPGNGDEGSGEPVPGEDETTDPTDPVAPTTAVTITSTSIKLEGTTTHVKVAVSGVPGGTVQALINGRSGGADQITLDSQGLGTIDLRPSLTQILLNAHVTIQYLTENGAEYPRHTRLWALGATEEAAASAAPVNTDAVEARDPAAEQPAAVSSPATSESTAPVAEAPVAGAPVTEDPVTEDPVTEAPVTEDPVTEPVEEAISAPEPATAAAEDTEPAE